MKPSVCLRAAFLAAVLAGFSLAAQGEEPFRPFKAAWTLSGDRYLLPTEGDRPAAIVHLTGPLTVTSGEGLGLGLLGEVIGYDDGGELLAGRAVFTDEHGDRIFCRLKAEPMGAGRRATGTITGGTGRFAGLEGDFTFSWQYVVDVETGLFSARAVDIEGRTRRGAAKGKP